MCDINPYLLEEFDLKLYFKKQREQRKKQELQVKLLKAEKVEKIVNRILKINASSIREKTRKQVIKDKRCISMTLIQELVPMGPTITGNYFGFDHATCLHAKKVVGDLVDTNPVFRDKFTRMRNCIKKAL